MAALLWCRNLLQRTVTNGCQRENLSLTRFCTFPWKLLLRWPGQYLLKWMHFYIRNVSFIFQYVIQMNFYLLQWRGLLIFSLLLTIWRSMPIHSSSDAWRNRLPTSPVAVHTHSGQRSKNSSGIQLPSHSNVEPHLIHLIQLFNFLKKMSVCCSVLGRHDELCGGRLWEN